MTTSFKPEKCFVCGGEEFDYREVLWGELIHEWDLAPGEVEYINTQQGLYCKLCNSNLRSMTLAKSILIARKSKKTLASYVRSYGSKKIKVLEVNEAGNLHYYLKQFSRYTFAEYPEVDLHQLPYQDSTFDLVLHSYTLEHVEQPELALKEIHRVLKKGARTIFTTPIIVDRVTKSRKGMQSSFHGSRGITDTGMLVTYEYGSDFWKYIADAGFEDIQIITELYPAGIAFICKK